MSLGCFTAKAQRVWNLKDNVTTNNTTAGNAIAAGKLQLQAEHSTSDCQMR